MNTFEITIERKVEDGWPVVANYHQAGGLPVRKEGQLRIDEAILRGQPTPLGYGQILGRALFRDSVRDAFVSGLSATDEPLRVLLSVEDEPLRRLRWERLAAPLDGDWNFLALHQRTPFSLYLPSVTDRRFPPIGRRDLRALIVAASPAGLEKYHLAHFDVAAAVAGIRTALGDISHGVLAEMPGAGGPPTLDALAARLTAEPYTLLHLICHGQYVPEQGDTAIYLADEHGQVSPVWATAFIGRLSLLRGSRGLPHFAFLTICESAVADAEGAMGGLGQRLVRDLGMPAVLAMTDTIKVKTAADLAAVFYPQLSKHGDPDRALAEACAGLANRSDITVPALFSRLGGRPLFSDSLDREPTSAEIEFGLGQLAQQLPLRAPVLADEFTRCAAALRGTPAAGEQGLSRETRAEAAEALRAVNVLSEEALDLSFNALALGQQPPPYDNRCPFMGLQSFTEESAEFFFGREKLAERLEARLAEHPFLAVLGPSGSGKSSLVRAGLMRRLRDRDPELRAAVMTPGNDPLAGLDRTLQTPPTGGRSLLVVDQFEEIFTLTMAEVVRREFIGRLLALPGGWTVVVAMRADFWGDCAPYPALREAMQAHQELIAAMSAAELRSAMEQQAAAVRLRFEADLANTILDDAAGEPGAMPLLQHALRELWKRRHGRWLRGQEYRALGGVQGAIARTAEGVCAALSSADQTQIREILLRLVRLDEEDGRRDTRRRATLDELVTTDVDRDTVVRLVARLADEKLVVTSVDPVSGKQTVELAHEALIGQWGRLRGWIDENRAALRLRQAIGQDAQEWETLGREAGAAYRGAKLAQAEEWRTAHPAELNRLEAEFLSASIAERDREAQEAEQRRQLELALAQKRAEEAEARARAQARAVKRLRWAVAISLVVALVPVLMVLMRVLRANSVWQPAPGAPRNAAQVLAASPDSPDVAPYFCAGTLDMGLACSHDGARWNVYQEGFPVGTPGLDAGAYANDAYGVRAIAFDLGSPRNIYLSLYGKGVYSSTDQGLTMAPTGPGLPPQQAPTTLAADGDLVLATLDDVEGYPLYASRDRGRHWALVGGGGVGPLEEARTVLISPDRKSILVGTKTGVFASPRDDSFTWVRMTHSAPVSFIRPDPASPNTYYLATSDPERHVAEIFVWSPGPEPTFLTAFPHEIGDLTADPEPDGATAAYALLYDTNQVYAVSRDGRTVALGRYPGWLNWAPIGPSTHLSLLAVRDPDKQGTVLWLGHSLGVFRHKGDLRQETYQ